MDRTLRLFLAMLALVAGLGAAPAQARMTPADTAEMERVDSGRSSGSAIATAAAEVQGQARGDRHERVNARQRRPATVVVMIPSIQLGDRPLE